ncbi:hypothetical protein [Nocardia sp. NPDC057353]|uniref:hypothetical protein n=1 Tax=Nocardia sp. NPDC057353 TaxID=3346104 RepID=UPI00362CB859
MHTIDDGGHRFRRQVPGVLIGALIAAIGITLVSEPEAGPPVRADDSSELVASAFERTAVRTRTTVESTIPPASDPGSVVPPGDIAGADTAQPSADPGTQAPVPPDPPPAIPAEPSASAGFSATASFSLEATFSAQVTITSTSVPPETTTPPSTTTTTAPPHTSTTSTTPSVVTTPASPTSSRTPTSAQEESPETPEREQGRYEYRP